jgi:hypothetical protein
MGDFGEGKTVKVRKPHRCEWCGEKIDVGSLVYHYRGRFDDSWQNWYMHPECERACTADRDNLDGFSPYENERPHLNGAI